MEAALQQAAAQGSGSSSGSSPSAPAASGADGAVGGSDGGGWHSVLLTDQVHAAYAAADVAERAELASQADALLLAGMPQLASPADAAGPAAGGAAGLPSGGVQQAEGAPALTAELSPAVLRSHWLLRLQLEWEAALAESFSPATLAQRRQQRRCGGVLGGRQGAVGLPCCAGACVGAAGKSCIRPP